MNFKRIARNLEYLANFEMKSFSDEKYISNELNKYIRANIHNSNSKIEHKC